MNYFIRKDSFTKIQVEGGDWNEELEQALQAQEAAWINGNKKDEKNGGGWDFNSYNTILDLIKAFILLGIGIYEIFN